MQLCTGFAPNPKPKIGHAGFVRGDVSDCGPLKPVCIFTPAKINLLLAITGRRPDGYHDLVSLVAPLDWGDTLEVAPADDFSLICDDPTVPADGSNLVLRAAAAFRQASGWRGGATFRLTKRIPMGAGLGGGSSDAVAALRALNELAGQPLDHAGLVQLAAGLGADCALFMAGVPVVMRGKGDRIELLPPAAAARLRGQRVMVFKPGFGVATAWAYGRMAAQPQHYVAAGVVEARWARWLDNEAATPADIVGNNMEGVVFGKFPALPVLHERLRERFGLRPGMSGSGSASFVFVAPGHDENAITGCIREAWGPGACVVAANLT